jgi:hypothetical protein
MAQTNTSWRNGQSGNPKGRPPMRTRPLATALREIGAEQTADQENRTTVALLVWKALRTGNLELDSGKRIDLTAKEWLELVKWVHHHVDGGLKHKDQYAETRDQQSQLAEILADLDFDDASAESDAPADPVSQPEPVLRPES